MARDRRIERQVHIVEAEASRRRDILDAGSLQPHRPGRHQRVALDRLIVDQRVVRRSSGVRSGGPAASSCGLHAGNTSFLNSSSTSSPE